MLQMNKCSSFLIVNVKKCKGASTSSNIASNIAGTCVAEPSTLSKFQQHVRKLQEIQASTSSNIAGNIASNIADNIECVQLSSNIACNFQLF